MSISKMKIQYSKRETSLSITSVLNYTEYVKSTLRKATFKEKQNKMMQDVDKCKASKLVNQGRKMNKR